MGLLTKKIQIHNADGVCVERLPWGFGISKDGELVAYNMDAHEGVRTAYNTGRIVVIGTDTGNDNDETWCHVWRPFPGHTAHNPSKYTPDFKGVTVPLHKHDCY